MTLIYSLQEFYLFILFRTNRDQGPTWTGILQRVRIALWILKHFIFLKQKEKKNLFDQKCYFISELEVEGNHVNYDDTNILYLDCLVFH